MTVNQAATILAIQPATVRQAIASGRLKATKRGRDWWLTPSEVERYAAKRKPAPRRP